MNIKKLRYIVAIANTGTFREASEQLYVSQPSMSIAVKDLEVELGFKIFDRLNVRAVLQNHARTHGGVGQRYADHGKAWI